MNNCAICPNCPLGSSTSDNMFFPLDHSLPWHICLFILAKCCKAPVFRSSNISSALHGLDGNSPRSCQALTLNKTDWKCASYVFMKGFLYLYLQSVSVRLSLIPIHKLIHFHSLIYKCVYIYIHTYIRIYIRIYTHTYI